MRRGFDTYWLAGGEIWAARAGAPCQIDLELAVALHALHVREAAATAYAGDRTAAADHRDRAAELAHIIREQSEARRGSLALGEAGL
jgi:hypothetical protein